MTPSFNQAEYIRDTIESVLAQDYPDFEHIVVDGGSTDATVDILRSYDHLIWTSEPDTGQSDALNKGFARARGDVIAWINSDDYYARGAFLRVTEALDHSPVVLGPCQIVDAAKHPTQLIENLSHSWFDILKYWVPDSIPTQPSIFFRREAMEASRRSDGSYLDPDLNYVMDYDLWLRMARLFPFTNRLEEVLSYYRMYGTNKTGGDWSVIHAEASRVFARFDRSGTGKRLALAMSLSEGGVENTLGALSRQTLKDFEVLLLAAPHVVRGRALVEELQRGHPSLPLRYVPLHHDDPATFLDSAATHADASLVCVLEPGLEVDRHFCLRLSNMFDSDYLGAAALASTVETRHGIVVTARELNASPDAVMNELLTRTFSSRLVAVRRVALDDVGGAPTGSTLQEVVAGLLVRLAHKGWHVALDPPSERVPQDRAARRMPFDTIAWLKDLAVDLARDFEREPFADRRRQAGLAIEDPSSLWRSMGDATAS